jgi:hypothetical protein
MNNENDKDLPRMQMLRLGLLCNHTPTPKASYILFSLAYMLAMTYAHVIS